MSVPGGVSDAQNDFCFMSKKLASNNLRNRDPMEGTREELGVEDKEPGLGRDAVAPVTRKQPVATKRVGAAPYNVPPGLAQSGAVRPLTSVMPPPYRGIIKQRQPHSKFLPKKMKKEALSLEKQREAASLDEALPGGPMLRSEGGVQLPLKTLPPQKSRPVFPKPPPLPRKTVAKFKAPRFPPISASTLASPERSGSTSVADVQASPISMSPRAVARTLPSTGERGGTPSQRPLSPSFVAEFPLLTDVQKIRELSQSLSSVLSVSSSSDEEVLDESLLKTYAEDKKLDDEIRIVEGGDMWDTPADTVDVHASGVDRFIRGSLITVRRESFAQKVRREATEVAGYLDRLSLKVSARLKELRDTVNKQEAMLRNFKAAYVKATASEMNEMILAGWSRHGHLGFIDVTQYLSPILKNQQLFPVGVLKQVFPSASDFMSTTPGKRKGRRKWEFEDPMAPPRIPKLRAQRISLPTPIEHCCKAVKCCPLSTEKKGVVPGQLNDVDDATSSDSTESPEVYNKLNHADEGSRTSLGIQQYEKRRRATFVQLIGQLQFGSEERVERPASIRTFLFLKTTGDNVCPDLPPRDDIELKAQALLAEAENKVEEDSSLDSDEYTQIDSTVAQVQSPRFLGKRVESFWARWCRVKVEPTEHYRKSIRETLIRYYKKEKQFRRRCIGILPGGLSTVQLSPPPCPGYPPGGLETPQSSFSSKDMLSDILSDTAGNGSTNEELGAGGGRLSSTSSALTSSEEDFAALFQLQQPERITSNRAGSISAAAAARRADHLFQSVPLSPQISRRPPATRNQREIYTTSFEIGAARTPTLFVELCRAIEQLPAEEAAASAVPWEPSEAAHAEALRWDKCFNRCLTPLECCVNKISDLAEHSGSRPARVTELWQLADDVNSQRAVWIYRGRVVTPIG